MKKRNLGIISAVFLFIAAVTLYQLVWAFPPTPPPPSGIYDPSNVAITGGNIAGNVTVGAGRTLTVSGAVNATSSTWTGLSANTTGNAATATSLAANPTDCAANTVATAIDATGNLTCGYALNADIQAYDADLTTWADVTPGANVTTLLATPSSASSKANCQTPLSSNG